MSRPPGHRIGAVVIASALGLLAVDHPARSGSEGSIRSRPPGGAIVWGTGGAALVVTDLRGRQLLRLAAAPRSSAAFSTNLQRLAVTDDTLRLVTVATGRTRTLIERGELPEELGAPVFSPGGKLVAVGYGDSSCYPQRPSAGIALARSDGSATVLRPVWPRARPWRQGQFTRFIMVAEVTDSADLSFYESRYSYGECRYQELRRQLYWWLGAGSTNPEQLLSEPELGDVAWSPDRMRVAYTVGDGNACDLWVDSRRGALVRIVHREYVLYGCWVGGGIPFAWSPDSRTLFYADGMNVVAWDRDSGRDETVFRPPGAPQHCQASMTCARHDAITLSRNGAWLLLIQRSGRSRGRSDVFLAATNGSRMRRLDRPPGVDRVVAARLG